MNLRRGQILGPNRDDLALIYVVLVDIPEEKINRARNWDVPASEEEQLLKIEIIDKGPNGVYWLDKGSLDGDGYVGLLMKLRNNKLPIAEEKHLRKAVKVIFSYKRRGKDGTDT